MTAAGIAAWAAVIGVWAIIVIPGISVGLICLIGLIKSFRSHHLTEPSRPGVLS